MEFYIFYLSLIYIYGYLYIKILGLLGNPSFAPGDSVKICSAIQTGSDFEGAGLATLLMMLVSRR
jgi:hypothetical protein